MYCALLLHATKLLSKWKYTYFKRNTPCAEQYAILPFSQLLYKQYGNSLQFVPRIRFYLLFLLNNLGKQSVIVEC